MASTHKSPPLATIGGSLVILLFCIFTLASISQYPGPFSPVDNWLSDLGTPLLNPSGEIYFNAGCILTGLVMLLMVAGLGVWKEGKNGTMLMLGRACGAISAVALMLIGVFHEGTIYHTILAFTFFVLLALFVGLVSAALWKHPAYSRWLGYYTAIVIVIDIVFVITFIVYEHAPVWEWLAVFSGLVWAALLAYNTLRL